MPYVRLSRRRGVQLVLLLFLLAAFVSPAAAQKKNKKVLSGPAAIGFINLTWDMDSAAVREHLVAEGYTQASSGPEGDLRFRGRLAVYDALVLTQFVEGHLAKVMVMIPRSSGEPQSVYPDMVRYFTEKYGPSAEVEDPDVMRGFRSTGADRVTWVVPDSTLKPEWFGRTLVNLTDHYHLVVGMVPSVGVALEYMAPTWEREKDRREQARRARFNF